MIHLDYNRTLKRETTARFQGRVIAIYPQPHALTIWLKGTRVVYSGHWEQIFKLCAENEARRRREERAAQRKRKRHQ
jgi:hypothetical protein